MTGNRNLFLSTWTPAALVILSLSLNGTDVSCQEGAFAFQIRGGATAPVAGFLDEGEGWEEKAGPHRSFGMGFTFPLYRSLGGYLGFSQHRFACDSDVCPEGEKWITTGFDVALRMVFGRTGLRSWIQAGIHTNRIEGVVFERGDERSLHSEGGGGYEMGGGVLVEVGERMSLAPGIRYGLSDVPFATRPSLGLRYLVVDLGLVLGF
ncbi:MAG: hypothetical protein HKO65_07365 [Gemmatimonadetes bacterium]|nr:hypothetical protein [Gemmatimonadota bacterium]NNM04907.1 hypothetical protein [Gemmatimonadota bacterium]